MGEGLETGWYCLYRVWEPPDSWFNEFFDCEFSLKPTEPRKGE